ncbi:MAG: YraN family protein [Deltaproteobacteria bacterium]|nr:YraN family protein [Deltaproteobacteria bacterium]MBW1912456.1 YraN family protein [Deltaproteobacteria bacterium]
MTRERLELGRKGEDLALRKVKRLGYKCIARNYRCPLGEIDLIARDGDCLVFIEIKTRKGRSVGYAKEAIDKRKMRQISKVALAYMKANDCCDVRARFDVVAINMNEGREEIEVIQNAFDLAY